MSPTGRQDPGPPRRRLAGVLLGIYLLFAAAAFTWPVFPWLGDHLEPRVLGMPWVLAYNLLWVLLTFLALLAYHLSRRGRP